MAEPRLPVCATSADAAPAEPSGAAAGPATALVTVGIPAYQNAATIARTIRSIRAQTFPRWQIVISDDASTDETFAVCAGIAGREPRIRLIRQPRNLRYMNFRFLLDQADTPYFAWLAGDDHWHPSFLEACLAALEARPDAISALPRCEFANAANIVAPPPDTVGLEGPWQERARDFLARPNGTRMYGLFRTAVLKRAFPPRNIYAYDFALMLGALREGPQLGVDRTLLTRSRSPWQSYSRSVRTLYRSRLLRAFPLLELTAYLLWRRLVPLRPALLGRLAVLNAEKHEAYVFVNRPDLYARLLPLYRFMSLPLARQADNAVSLGGALLDHPDPDARRRARRLLERLAGRDVARADMILGRHWRDPGHALPDFDRAIGHFERAAEAGVADARAEVVRTAIRAGRLPAAARAQAYLDAGRLGSADAAIELARLVSGGTAGAIDLAEARRVLAAFAADGHPAVLCALGTLAEREGGDAAIALYAAAVASEPRAAREVGRLVRRMSDGKAAEAAVPWFHRAAAAGDPRAQRELASLLAATGAAPYAAGGGSGPKAGATSREPAPAIAQVVPARGQSALSGAGARDLVVWGVHRSGTSVLARALEAMGWQLGRANRTAAVENPSGFFENRAVVELDRQLLAFLGTSWSNWAFDFASARFDARRFDPWRQIARSILDALDAAAGEAPWAIKDPRMAALSGFWLPVLRERRPPPRHVLLLRDPGEVADSQVARAVADPGPHRLLHRREAMLVLWISHVLALVSAAREEELLVVLHGDLAADAGPVMATIAAFAGAPRGLEELGAAAFQARYRRSSRPKSGDGPWSAMADQLYRRLADRAGALLRAQDREAILGASSETRAALSLLRPFAPLLAAVDRGEVEWFAHDGLGGD